MDSFSQLQDVSFVGFWFGCFVSPTFPLFYVFGLYVVYGRAGTWWRGLSPIRRYKFHVCFLMSVLILWMVLRNHEESSANSVRKPLLSREVLPDFDSYLLENEVTVFSSPGVSFFCLPPSPLWTPTPGGFSYYIFSSLFMLASADAGDKSFPVLLREVHLI